MIREHHCINSCCSTKLNINESKGTSQYLETNRPYHLNECYFFTFVIVIVALLRSITTVFENYTAKIVIRVFVFNSYFQKMMEGC